MPADAGIYEISAQKEKATPASVGVTIAQSIIHKISLSCLGMQASFSD